MVVPVANESISMQERKFSPILHIVQQFLQLLFITICFKLLVSEEIAQIQVSNTISSRYRLQSCHSRT